MVYKFISITLPDGKISDGVQFIREDGSIFGFPADQDNVHYQAYLKWLEEGNVPEPADDA